MGHTVGHCCTLVGFKGPRWKMKNKIYNLGICSDCFSGDLFMEPMEQVSHWCLVIQFQTIDLQVTPCPQVTVMPDQGNFDKGRLVVQWETE